MMKLMTFMGLISPMFAYIISAGHSSDRTPLYFCRFEQDGGLPVRLLICPSLGDDSLKCICSAIQREPDYEIYSAELRRQGHKESLVVHKEFGKKCTISKNMYKYYSILVHA